ncbi:hypothetical protein TSH7_29425 [Azospirillum sp. TSH7]|nr:hypothetical protein TSH7_29425 [Azospirillum sp. TSH7]PWC69458.1 hypothetical protein TSH20_08985 [Azospirillum sp. TSH20]
MKPAECVDLQRLNDIDLLLIQRNAIAPWLVEPVVSACRTAKIPIVMDLDDDLLAVPEEKDPDGRYAFARSGILTLAKAATCVTVSTTTLAERLAPVTNKVVHLPNYISERLWLSPLEEVSDVPEQLAPKSGDEVRILYMGTATHREDLEIIRTPMLRLMEQHSNVRFFVIGGETPPGDWYEAISVPGNRTNYPDFVPWLRAICQTMSFGVAPLADTFFNAAKSELKYLDYAVAGLAGLYSDTVSYRQCVIESGGGLLVPNNTDDWYSALCRMVATPEITLQLCDQARNWVTGHRLLRRSLAEFDQLLLQLAPTRASRDVRHVIQLADCDADQSRVMEPI